MGAEFKDYDNDGLPDLFVTALAGETYPALSQCRQGQLRRRHLLTSRVGPLTVKHSGWGLGLFDFNNDGWKDLFTANSHVNDRVEAFEAAVYQEANSVFANAGGAFQDVSAEAGLTPVKAHRGAAFADFDGDGRIDAVVSSLGAPAELWQNVSPEPRTGSILRLRGTKSNRDGIGARIRIARSIRRNDHRLGLRLVKRLGRAFWSGQHHADSENRNSLAERSRHKSCRMFAPIRFSR